MYVLRDFDALAVLLNEQEFEHVWTVGLCRTVDDVTGFHAPTVTNDPEGDVDIDSEDWHVLTGNTGQHGYSGAVMHPSETFGRDMAMEIAHMCDAAYEDGRKLAFAVVTVDDIDSDDVIGWAVTWRNVPRAD